MTDEVNMIEERGSLMEPPSASSGRVGKVGHREL